MHAPWKVRASWLGLLELARAVPPASEGELNSAPVLLHRRALSVLDAGSGSCRLRLFDDGRLVSAPRLLPGGLQNKRSDGFGMGNHRQMA
jgi:hypothetical protein